MEATKQPKRAQAVQEPASGQDSHDSTPSEFTFTVDWRTGPRTRAWDELWRRLLAGLAGVPGYTEVPEADTPAVRGLSKGAGRD